MAARFTRTASHPGQLRHRCRFRAGTLPLCLISIPFWRRFADHVAPCCGLLNGPPRRHVPAGCGAAAGGGAHAARQPSAGEGPILGWDLASTPQAGWPAFANGCLGGMGTGGCATCQDAPFLRRCAATVRQQPAVPAKCRCLSAPLTACNASPCPRPHPAVQSGGCRPSRRAALLVQPGQGDPPALVAQPGLGDPPPCSRQCASPVCFSCRAEERRVAICVMDDVLEHSPAGAAKYAGQVGPATCPRV